MMWLLHLPLVSQWRSRAAIAPVQDVMVCEVQIAESISKAPRKLHFESLIQNMRRKSLSSTFVVKNTSNSFNYL